MVEIVGKDESLKLRETCRKCGSILEFYPNEVKSHSGYCMGDYETTFHIQCPTCSNDITLNRENSRKAHL